jgi:Regulator of chromosome condensation (RCC1) repeat
LRPFWASAFTLWATIARADQGARSGLGLDTWPLRLAVEPNWEAPTATSKRQIELTTELDFERWAHEPFERKAWDFQRRCLNPCLLGGWGTCEVDARIVRDECQAIAGRSILSTALRRAPMVRDVLKLVGSQAAKMPTDVERGLHFSAAFVRGGGTLGIVARW